MGVFVTAGAGSLFTLPNELYCLTLSVLFKPCRFSVLFCRWLFFPCSLLVAVRLLRGEERGDFLLPRSRERRGGGGSPRARHARLPHGLGCHLLALGRCVATPLPPRSAAARTQHKVSAAQQQKIS